MQWPPPRFQKKQKTPSSKAPEEATLPQPPKEVAAPVAPPAQPTTPSPLHPADLQVTVSETERDSELYTFLDGQELAELYRPLQQNGFKSLDDLLALDAESLGEMGTALNFTLAQKLKLKASLRSHRGEDTHVHAKQ